MTRALVFCVIACGISTPACAGERNAKGVVAKRVTMSPAVLLAPDPAPAMGKALPLRMPTAPTSDFLVHMRKAPEPMVALQTAEQAIGESHLVRSDVRTPAAWRITDDLAATDADNGTEIVSDILADHRRPRAYRPSALNAMFVLRIDGKDDSPPFSVGGGGVAAVLWKAMPQ